MEKVINVDILKEEDLLEKYNVKRANKNLIEYLIKESRYVEDYEKITVLVNNKCKTKIDIIEKITEGLKDEYDKVSREYHRNNIIQIALIILGIVFLFISSLIDESVIWKEVVLIIGWVPIWEAVDLELFRDFSGRRRKKIIAKLLSSDIEEK